MKAEALPLVGGEDSLSQTFYYHGQPMMRQTLFAGGAAPT